MLAFRKLFPRQQSVIAMVHAAAFPGTPKYGGSIQKIVDKACTEAEIYLDSGVDGILVENMNDVPYIKRQHFGPETVATMARICNELRKIIPATVPCGIQILAAGNREALSVAHACSFNFIRSEGFVFGHVADEGLIEADAGLLLRYRKSMAAESVLVFADIKKKHSSHTVTSDVSLVGTAKAAEFFLSDGVILTGTATGNPASVQELIDLKQNCSLPVLVGSGVTRENLHEYKQADALIVGSHFKNGGIWSSDVNRERVKLFMDRVKVIRESSVQIHAKWQDLFCDVTKNGTDLDNMDYVAQVVGYLQADLGINWKSWIAYYNWRAFLLCLLTSILTTLRNGGGS